MHELLNDPIDVMVSFKDDRVLPCSMKWNQQEYTIKTVNLVRSIRKGAKRIFYFSVSDLNNYFRLRLDPECLEWRLVEVYTDG